MFSRRSGVWTIGSQSIALFGEVMKPLEGAALLEEVCHWEKGEELIALSHF